MSLTIDRARAVFTLINTFEGATAQQSELIKELVRVTRTLTGAMPGFVGAAVHRALDGQHVVNYVQWESRAHFDAMLSDERMKEHLGRVAMLARTITPRFYEIAFVRGGAS